MLQKAKELVNEANTKAAKDEADRQIKEEAKAKEEEEKKQQALKTSQEKQTVSSSTSKPTSNSSDQSKTGISKDLASCISATAWKEFSRLASYRSAIVKEAEPLNTDKTLKQYKFDLHKAVTTPINAISDQSPRHLLDKIERLAQLLSGQAVQMGGKQISIIKHPAAKVKSSFPTLFILSSVFIFSIALQGEIVEQLRAPPDNLFYMYSHFLMFDSTVILK